MKKLELSQVTKAIAAELRAERAKKKVTFDELARETGFAKPTVNNYLNGKREMPLGVFLDICRSLGVSAGEIADRAEKTVAAESTLEEITSAASAAGVPDSGAGDSGTVVFGEGDGRIADNSDDVDDVLALVEEARRSGVGLAALESDPRLAESEDFFD